VNIGAKQFNIDRNTGIITCINGTPQDAENLTQCRTELERSLYAFSRIVLGRDLLTQSLHRPLCEWLTTFPHTRLTLPSHRGMVEPVNATGITANGSKYRKLCLYPRDHYKTTIVCQSLPVHILIQSPETNIYLPGRAGPDSHILLACEAQQIASKRLVWIETQFESNTMLRQLWPHRLWDNPRRESKKWNETAMFTRGGSDKVDSSIEAVGVGGAVTGAHYDILIKDDLVTLEAANSPAVMETAKQWHTTSRALTHDPDKFLEFIIGTRWAVQDLYDDIQKDSSVEVLIRAIIEDGEIILPELFTHETIARLRKEHGVMFPLLYMNSAADPELTDFDISLLRHFSVRGDQIVFDDDDRDAIITNSLSAPPSVPDVPPGARLNRETYDMLKARHEYLRFRVT